MRQVRYHGFGGPDVFVVDEVAEPHAGPGQIRVVVNAVGINPIDWKRASGNMGGELPGVIGVEAAGVVDEVADDVTDVTAGDAVFGLTSGGAADFAILDGWAQVPAELDFVHAVALGLSSETAVRALDEVGVESGMTVIVNGGAGAVGSAAVQIAIDRGVTVIATASERNFERLRGYGALVTTYGDGLPGRVAELAPNGVDRAVDMGPGGALPELIEIVGGDPSHVITISDFAGAEQTGVKGTGGPGVAFRYDALDHAATLAERGKLTIPIERTFPLEDVVAAETASATGHVTGKLVLTVE